MLKVTEETIETIKPQDLTDKHFVGAIWVDGVKSFVQKIDEGSYCFATIRQNSNNYTHKQTYKTIQECLKFEDIHGIVATLDCDEFKDWFFEQ